MRLNGQFRNGKGWNLMERVHSNHHYCVCVWRSMPQVIMIFVLISQQLNSRLIVFDSIKQDICIHVVKVSEFGSGITLALAEAKS